MKDRYILDSSIWVELERKNSSVMQRVLPLLEKNQVCLVDVIVVELLRGARTHKDYKRLRQAFMDFVQLTTAWERVSELAFRVDRRGFHPPLIDLYIAQCAIDNKRTLVTQDKHFVQIAKTQAFKVELLKPRQKIVT